MSDEDEMVLSAQRFINSTYGDVPGITRVEETGVTDWPTLYALTRALQHELGITALSDNFGPTTLAALASKWPSIDASSTVPADVVRILQSALHCKGYDAGDIDGTYGERTAAAVRQVKADSGLDGPYPGDAVAPKLFKALLNMDAYALQDGGGDAVRAAQRWMNATYTGRANFFVIACDGRYSRDVQRALIFAVQYEIGLTDDVANGVFGPGTQDGLKSVTLRVGSTGSWVRLFTAAMAFNQRRGVTFTDTYDGGLAARVGAFQEFVKLPLNGKGDFATWASLLVSRGDTARKGTAADCASEVTAARAQALADAGYRVIGRYLSNAPGATFSKMIKPGELKAMASAGLSCFPIYQTNGRAASYFTAEQGTSDAADALYWARYHGFRPGTRIYFAVDYDAVDSEVTSGVLPYFRALKSALDTDGPGYRTGIYGPRAVCTRVGAEGLTSASFVSDMSTAYSGNVSSPLPEDWAFDQIVTIDVGSGDGAIEIDNNIASGRDHGQISYDPPAPATDLDVRFDTSLRAAALADVRNYLQSCGLPEQGPGDPTPTSTTVRPGASSTTEAFDTLVAHDAVLTALARSLRLRKALIATDVLWSARTGRAASPKAAGADKLGVDSTAYDLIETAQDRGLPRPGLTDTTENTRRLLGDPRLGLYQVLEKYYAPLRAGR